jgi:hypothetical protein
MVKSLTFLCFPVVTLAKQVGRNLIFYRQQVAICMSLILFSFSQSGEHGHPQNLFFQPLWRSIYWYIYIFIYLFILLIYIVNIYIYIVIYLFILCYLLNFCQFGDVSPLFYALCRKGAVQAAVGFG